MQKKIIALLFLMLTISISTTATAADLPIDITAIGRQTQNNTTITHPTTRFGTHLFTADAQTVNEAMAEQIRRRQATSAHLFEAITFDTTTDPHTQLTAAANNAALFAQPTDFSHITIPQETDPLPWWLIAAVLSACTIGGFIWAITNRTKKKASTADVH